MRPRDVIAAFDQFLASQGIGFEAVVIGGTALNLLGVIDRATKDCDVLDPIIPREVAEAAQRFAAEQRERGNALQDEWLNNGPASLVPALPEAWQSRLEIVFAGTALKLRSLGRTDLLCSKLFALCDRALDLQDCLALAPTEAELEAILGWLEEQDTHPDWPSHVREVIADLGGRLGHGA